MYIINLIEALWFYSCFSHVWYRTQCLVGNLCRRSYFILCHIAGYFMSGNAMRSLFSMFVNFIGCRSPQTYDYSTWLTALRTKQALTSSWRSSLLLWVIIITITVWKEQSSNRFENHCVAICGLAECRLLFTAFYDALQLSLIGVHIPFTVPEICMRIAAAYTASFRRIKCSQFSAHLQFCLAHFCTPFIVFRRYDGNLLWDESIETSVFLYRTRYMLEKKRNADG